jgi:signal transduction histidine kinase
LGPDVTRSGGEVAWGLFITRRVVEAHGGKVWVDPAHPGAIFQMLLPVEGKELQRFAS